MLSPFEELSEGCIWRHDFEALAGIQGCDPSTWSGSVQKELREHGLNADLSAEPGPFRPYPRCAALLLVKDEADIIHANLSWLFRMGVRRFVVVDNMSTDTTPSEIHRFAAGHPQADLLVLQDQVVGYHQSAKTTAMAEFARTRWPDIEWLLPIDADEFCVAKHGVIALAYVPAHVQALTIPKVVHFLHSSMGEGTLFERMRVRCPPFCVPPKIFLRANGAFRIDHGNHKIYANDGTPVHYTGGFQYGFFHREFQTRSFSQFLSKIRNGGAAILAARAKGDAVGGDHWLEHYRILMEEGEAGLRAVYDRNAFRTPGGLNVLDPFP